MLLSSQKQNVTRLNYYFGVAGMSLRSSQGAAPLGAFTFWGFIRTEIDELLKYRTLI